MLLINALMFMSYNRNQNYLSLLFSKFLSCQAIIVLWTTCLLDLSYVRFRSPLITLPYAQILFTS